MHGRWALAVVTKCNKVYKKTKRARMTDPFLMIEWKHHRRIIYTEVGAFLQDVGENPQ